jgi:hypothetical protein
MTTNRGRSNEKGEGRVGLLITLIIVAVAIFLGVKIIPVRIAAYEFRDVLREEARYGAVRNSDSVVTKRILEKAAELEIPLKKQDLKVRRTPGQMIITATYEQPIDLKVTTYVYKFNETEKAPLF